MAALREAVGRRMHTRWSSVAPVAQLQLAEAPPQLQPTNMQPSTQPVMYVIPQWQGAAQSQQPALAQQQLQQRQNGVELMQQPVAAQVAGSPVLQGGDMAPMGLQGADFVTVHARDPASRV